MTFPRSPHRRALVACFALAAFAARADDGPPPGRYQCVSTAANTTIGWLYVLPDRQYKVVAGGTVGRFTYEPGSHEMVFKSGKYVDYAWRGWYLAPGVRDQVRSDSSRQRHAIALVDKAKDVTPFSNPRKADNAFVRCYLRA